MLELDERLGEKLRLGADMLCELLRLGAEKLLRLGDVARVLLWRAELLPKLLWLGAEKLLWLEPIELLRLEPIELLRPPPNELPLRLILLFPRSML